MSRFLLTPLFKCVDPKMCDLNKYKSNSSKGCVLEFHLEYSKGLCEFYNDYSLAPEKL